IRAPDPFCDLMIADRRVNAKDISQIAAERPHVARRRVVVNWLKCRRTRKITAVRRQRSPRWQLSLSMEELGVEPSVVSRPRSQRLEASFWNRRSERDRIGPPKYSRREEIGAGAKLRHGDPSRHTRARSKRVKTVSAD